jgi:hypothetical protein
MLRLRRLRLRHSATDSRARRQFCNVAADADGGLVARTLELREPIPASTRAAARRKSATHDVSVERENRDARQPSDDDGEVKGGANERIDGTPAVACVALVRAR